MRVIAEIASYLDRQGLLSDIEVAYLHREGFLPLPEYEPEWDDGYQPYWDDFYSEFQEEEETAAADALGRRRRRTRQRYHSGRLVSAAELSAALRARIPLWTEDIDALTAVARALDPIPGPRMAPLALMRSEPIRTAGAIRDCLQRQQGTLRSLWRGIEFDRYRSPFGDDIAVDGPAIRAYDSLLRGDGRREAALKRAGWVLRYWPVRWACQVARAQRAVMAACGALYDIDFPLISRELSRDLHGGAFWAFVLLYNARRPQQGLRAGAPIAALGERLVVTQPRSVSEVARAWEAALLMDRPAAIGLLSGAGRTDERGEFPPLICPARWDKAYSWVEQGEGTRRTG